MFKVRRVCLEHLRPLELSPGGFGIPLSAGLQKPVAVGHDVHVDALVRRVTPDRVLAFINLSPRETATDDPGVNSVVYPTSGFSGCAATPVVSHFEPLVSLPQARYSTVQMQAPPFPLPHTFSFVGIGRLSLNGQ